MTVVATSAGSGMCEISFASAQARWLLRGYALAEVTASHYRVRGQVAALVTGQSPTAL